MMIRQHLYRRLQQAYASGSLRLVKRVHALLAIAEGMTVHDTPEATASCSSAELSAYCSVKSDFLSSNRYASLRYLSTTRPMTGWERS